LRPNDPDPHFRIATIHAGRGRWAEAGSEYEQALARDADHFLSHLNLALVAERLGQTTRAVTHYRAFLSTAPADASYDASRARARGALVGLGGTGAG
jgi:Tfp pilus assembly protein PilF